MSEGERRQKAISEVRQLLQDKMQEHGLGTSWEARALFLAQMIALEEVEGCNFLWKAGEDCRRYTRPELLHSLRLSMQGHIGQTRRLLDDAEGSA